MERLNKIKKHLEVAAENGCEGERVDAQETRSTSEWASDLYAMATQNVVMTEKHGGDLVASVLKAHGVKHIFCLSGGHISPFLVSSRQQGIRIIDVRHEVNAVFAADAVGRLTGIPGVAAVTAGPGVTNTVTAIKNAAMAQSPLILLGGAAATLMQGRGALQDIDQMAFLSPIVKWAYSCRTVRDIVPTLRKAFQVAKSGTPGPVFIELPLDVLYNVMELLPQGGTHDRLRAKDLQGSKMTPEIRKRVVVPREALQKGMSADDFVNSKPGDSPIFVELPDDKKSSFLMRTGFNVMISRLHAGVHDTDYDFSPLPVSYPTPKQNDVKSALALLQKAKRPVFILGSQAVLQGERGAAELVRALEFIGAPCFLGGMSRGMLGRNNPLHIRQNRGKALKKADLVCMFGVVADFRLDYGRGLPKNVPIVSVNRSLDDLTMNTGLFWTATLAAHSDPSDFVVELSKALGSSPASRFQGWAGDLKKADDEKEEANRQMMTLPALGRDANEGRALVNPLDLCQRLEDVLEDNSILVADGGDFVATASYIMRPRGPLSWLDPGAFGTLGVGGGFALGAALVHPEKQVYIIWGDGSAGYSILEFDTYLRHGVNVIALVGNDACWTQIEREQVPMFGDNAACVLSYSSYDVCAEGLGGKSVRIESPDDDITAKLKTAQQLAREGNSVLINALIGRTTFREGSISV